MPLTITVPAIETYDPETDMFLETKEQKLTLEHSLLSIAKWEAKWGKAFLSKAKADEKTVEESRDYVRCMTITQNVDPSVYYVLTDQNYNDILEYMQAPMTATWFNNSNQAPSREVLTNEVIYYYMAALNIPFECDRWHINRLLTLIRVGSEKNKPPKKMKQGTIMSQNQALNALRRKQLGTKG